MAKTTSRMHTLAEAVAEVASSEVKKAAAGPAAPMALLLDDATKPKKLDKAARKAAKKTAKQAKKQAKKTAKLERKALKITARADRTRPGAGRPPAAPLKAGRSGFSKKRTDLVDLPDEAGRKSTAQRSDLVDVTDETERRSTAQRSDLVDVTDETERRSTAQRTDLVDVTDETERTSTAQRTDLVDSPEDEPAIADAEGAFDTDPDADLDAQAEAEAERAARAAGAETDAEDDTDAVDDFDDNDTDDDTDDDLDDEFEKLLGGGSFGGRERKTTSFLAPRPKAAAKPTGTAGTDTDTDAGAEATTDEAAGSPEPSTEPTAAAGTSASVGELCKQIATWWRVLTPSAGALTVTDLKWLGGRLTPDQWTDLEKVAADEHKSLVARVTEQKLDVTDDGVLMHEVAGKREPLPVDDDGNPIAATAGAAADPEARAKALVEYRGGKLFRAKTAENDGVLVDTADSFSADGGAGWENVTVDKDGKFYLTSQQPGDDQVDVVDSGDVLMRGQIKVSLGSIGTLSNRADPDPVDGEALRAALTLLQGQGSRLLFKIVEIVENVRTTGREFLEEAVEAETVAAASPGTVAALKSVALWRELADEVGAAELGAIIESRGWRGNGTEIQDENGEPVDASLARDLLKKELADLEATKATATKATPAGRATSGVAAP